jgi:hypothetical protein
MPVGAYTHHQPDAAPMMPSASTTRPNQSGQQQVRRQPSEDKDKKKPLPWTDAEVPSHIHQSYQCLYIQLCCVSLSLGPSPESCVMMPPPKLGLSFKLTETGQSMPPQLLKSPHLMYPSLPVPILCMMSTTSGAVCVYVSLSSTLPPPSSPPLSLTNRRPSR